MGLEATNQLTQQYERVHQKRPGSDRVGEHDNRKTRMDSSFSDSYRSFIRFRIPAHAETALQLRGR